MGWLVCFCVMHGDLMVMTIVIYENYGNEICYDATIININNYDVMVMILCHYNENYVIIIILIMIIKKII